MLRYDKHLSHVFYIYRYLYLTILRDPVHRYLSEWKHVQRGSTWIQAQLKCDGRAATPDEVPLCYTGNCDGTKGGREAHVHTNTGQNVKGCAITLGEVPHCYTGMCDRRGGDTWIQIHMKCDGRAAIIR